MGVADLIKKFESISKDGEGSAVAQSSHEKLNSSVPLKSTSGSSEAEAEFKASSEDKFVSEIAEVQPHEVENADEVEIQKDSVEPAEDRNGSEERSIEIDVENKDSDQEEAEVVVHTDSPDAEITKSIETTVAQSNEELRLASENDNSDNDIDNDESAKSSDEEKLGNGEVAVMGKNAKKNKKKKNKKKNKKKAAATTVEETISEKENIAEKSANLDQVDTPENNDESLRPSST